MSIYLSFIVFALVSAPVILLLPPRWRKALVLLAVLWLLFLAFKILSGAPLGSASMFSFQEGVGLPPLQFQEHPLSRIAAFGFIFVGALALLYGLDAAKASEQATALVGIASAVGIVFSSNFISFFTFWELLTLSTSALIVIRRTPQAIVAGYKFLLFHIVGGLLMLLGIAEHYAVTGSFALTLPEAGLNFFTLAVGFKAAFLPFHVWVAWGYPSASFASSVVLAGLTTKIGVYALARLIPPSTLITFIGASMAVFGFSCALLQKNLRRLLSYHIISQVGYMVAAVAVGTTKSVDAGLLHLVNHMVYKALLFMSVGSLIYSTGTGNVHELLHQGEGGDGVRQPVWRALPVAAIGAVVGALAISGTPLFNGYVSKYLLKKAMYGLGLPETMLLVAGVGTAISFCKFVYMGFIKPRVVLLRPPLKSMNFSILAASAVCIIFGVIPALAEPLLPSGGHIHVYSFSGVAGALQFILAGVLVFLVSAGILEKGIKVPPWVSVEFLVYLPLMYGSQKACEYTTLFDGNINDLYERMGRTSKDACNYVGVLDSSTAYTEEESLDKPRERLRKIVELKKQEEKPAAFKKARGNLADRLRWTPGEFNIKNLNFDTLLLAFMLAIFLIILLYFSAVQ